jgi:SAM-dependent methyltransferase
VADDHEHPALRGLRRRLEDEEAAYARALAALDALAAGSSDDDGRPEPPRLSELNEMWAPPAAPRGRGLRSAFHRRVYEALRPVIEHQTRFNALLVRFLNASVMRTEHDRVRVEQLIDTAVRYAQRVEPLMDARDDMRVARAPSRAEQVLEVFDRKIEAMGLRLEGLLALRDRVETLSEELRAVQARPEAEPPSPDEARSTTQTAADPIYTAFENRFRGSREEIRTRQADYVELFRDQAPVVDLGCGRGEFLELLREAGIQSSGVEGNAHAARACRDRGLDVVAGDLLGFLQERPPGSLGGIFAAQVAEHLSPPVLNALLRESRRTLRPEGLLVLETVNPASALAFLDVFIRDLTHERPLHPETLRFLTAAAGFSDVRIEMRNPVPADVRLHLVPGAGLPPPVMKALNENVERLNTLLYAPLDYALVARR